jgi:hypothetical protein
MLFAVKCIIGWLYLFAVIALICVGDTEYAVYVGLAGLALPAILDAIPDELM